MNKSKLNLIAVVAVITIFANSMVVAETVYAQSGNGSSSSGVGSSVNTLKNSGSSGNGNPGSSGSTGSTGSSGGAGSGGVSGGGGGS